MSHQIPMMVSAHTQIRARLREAFPDIDDETLADTLEGLSDLPEALAEIVRSALDDEAIAGALKGRLGDMQARLARLTERARKKRRLVKRVMEDAGLTKLAEPDFTASLRAGPPPVRILAEDAIPAPFWRAQPPKLDRAGLAAALKAGDAIPGAALGAPERTLSIRVQ